MYILAFVVWCAIPYFRSNCLLSCWAGSRVKHARLAYVYVCPWCNIFMAYNIHYSLYCGSFIYEGDTNQSVNQVFTCLRRMSSLCPWNFVLCRIIVTKKTIVLDHWKRSNDSQNAISLLEFATFYLQIVLGDSEDTL